MNDEPLEYDLEQLRRRKVESVNDELARIGRLRTFQDEDEEPEDKVDPAGVALLLFASVVLVSISLFLWIGS